MNEALYQEKMSLSILKFVLNYETIKDMTSKKKEIDIPKIYNAKEHEDRIYQEWENGGFFNPEKNIAQGSTSIDAPSFTIMMPPPNVTGVLHLGHALENSLMDVMTRFQRMRGKRTLLVPGTDHAAVPTQARVEKDLMAQGMKNPRKELGREKLLEIIRDYVEKSKATILSQIRKLGTSCDWSRLAYTFDESRSKTVNTIFKKMYDDGLIYRGYRTVNWSVAGQCTHSEDELVNIEREAKLYTFKYSEDFPIPIATTRPETKLGDTAVAVHPDDERYKKYIGQSFTVNFCESKFFEIKIIGDSEVDPNFGTGALGVTPAHSQIDFDLKERHDLLLIQVIGKDGNMTEEAGEDYQGLSVETAREKVVQFLRENNLLINEEDTKQIVGTSERFGDVIEVIPMEQWFVNMKKEIPGRKKNLQQLMREAVAIGHNGDEKQKIILSPNGFEKRYFRWIDNIRDWCISRQIWWGHQIPVWYCENKCQPIVSPEKPKECSHCKNTTFQRDPDTLDTWFSSATWTFSTLGWPDKKADLNVYHPTSWIQMGYEIFFLWMARMILMSTYILDEIPFRNVYFHGLLRDKNGQKFSKSLRNNLDPLEMIEKYGTDALRMSMLMGVSPGNDMKFYEEKVEHYQHFVNKLWNISRYILISVKEIKLIAQIPEGNSKDDKVILLLLQKIINEVTESIENYEFSRAGEILYDFTWHDFADWYIEVAKIEKEKDDILLYVLQTLLKLWHPYMPFVTEKIWEFFDAPQKLIVQKWITTKELSLKDNLDIARVKIRKEIVKNIRSARRDFNIPVSIILGLRVRDFGEIFLIEEDMKIISKFARVEETLFVLGENEMHITLSPVAGKLLYLTMPTNIDFTKEKERINKEIKNLEDYTLGLANKLGNESFVKNAKPEIVEETQKKKEDVDRKLALLKKQLKQIN